MKRVYKILPTSLYDIPGLEQWLEEQADEGLFPNHLGAYVSFTKDGVPGTRYRLETWGKRGTEPTPEQLALYHSSGWEYAFSIGRVYFLFYTTDANAPEPYSDFVTRGQSLERLVRRIKRVRIMRLLASVIAIVTLLAVIFGAASRFDVQPDQWAKLPTLMLYLTKPIFLILLIIICFQIPRDFRDYRSLLNAYQALNNGMPPLSWRVVSIPLL